MEELIGEDFDEFGYELGLDTWLGDDLDELGADELIGDELDDLLGIAGDDEIGARRRRRRARTRSPRARVALAKIARAQAKKKALARGVAEVKRTASAGRLLIFGGVATASGATSLDITTTVQEVCRVDRLMISGVTAALAVIPPETYAISDIKVGTRSQLTANAAIPGIAFTSNNTAMMQGLGLDTLQPGTDFVVRLESGLVADNVFRFVAYATALR